MFSQCLSIGNSSINILIKNSIKEKLEKNMSIVQEFKEFAIKGNMMDLAIGVIIGGAFGKIIDSLVKDVLMPLISVITGGDVDFSQWFIVLGDNPNNLQTLEELQKAGINVLQYGSFLTVFINFLILAWVVFLLVKVMNRLRKQEAPVEAPAATPEDIELLREIRDELKRRPQV
jgi:large conductance mechanosensitive channel